MISALRALIRWARTTKAADDTNPQIPLQQLEYLGKTADGVPIYPYGMHANAEPDSRALIFSVDGHPDNRAIIVTSMGNREELAMGEATIYSPLTGSKVVFRANGDIEVESVQDLLGTVARDTIITIDRDMCIDVTRDAKLTVGGDLTATVSGAITATAVDDISATSSTGDVSITATIGDVNATATAGDINATATAGDICVTATAGAIDATAGTTLKATSTGAMTLTAPSIALTGTVTVNGALTVAGSSVATFTGDLNVTGVTGLGSIVTSSGTDISNSHTHPQGVDGGGDTQVNTGVPV